MNDTESLCLMALISMYWNEYRNELPSPKHFSVADLMLDLVGTMDSNTATDKAVEHMKDFDPTYTR